MIRAVALALLIAFTPGCAKTLTNVAGEQRRCTAENVTQSVYVCYGDACGILGLIAALAALASVTAYHACVEQAHQEGYE